ncbi:MAG: hypothetical protein JRM97_08230 [Nitrososphaerota archaeon]|nr:hypothetical protein [Nitrososphaerota archaeon]MDG6962016.1 hypothetical protein [Nitrososphaerota archaeon]MDG7018163.1 hypothetical protein [Nitrososphaerota archaeon]MDG7019644.1 hypothetical protein [Nitrososphaerota archaeon]MDG7032600.1 hypothetical protein [Nitrososphaerota archaeon]
MASALAASLVSPSLPLVGLAVAALVFLGVLLRGTKAYGPVLVALGVALLAYVYVAFHGGTIDVSIPRVQQYSVSGSVALGLASLMYLFMAPAVLTLVKGAVLTVMKPDGTPARPAP